MSDSHPHLEPIEQLIIQGQVDEAINQLLNFSKSKDQAAYEALIHLSQRNQSLKKSIHANVIDHNDAQVEQAKITQALLEQIRSLKDSSESPLKTKASKASSKKGIGLLRVLIFLIIVAAGAAMGYRYYSNKQVREARIDRREIQQSGRGNEGTVNPEIKLNTEDIKAVGVEESSQLNKDLQIGSNCRVYVDHAQAKIQEKPGTFEMDVARVPKGWYKVIQSKIITFAGRKQRWLQINVGNKTGWIQATTMLIKRREGCSY